LFFDVLREKFSGIMFLIHFVLGCPIVVFFFKQIFSKEKGKKKPKKITSNSIRIRFLKYNPFGWRF
jgi:hypothetical protein